MAKAVWEYTTEEWAKLSPEQRLAAPHASTGAPISATNYHLLNVRARLQRGESVPEKVVESYGPFNPLRADARSELERAKRMAQGQRPQSVSLAQAQERFDSLSDRRKAMDSARTAQNIAPAEADTDKERRLQQRWLKNPSRLDFQGVDTKKAGDLTDLRKAVVAADFAQSDAFRMAREAQIAGAPESEVTKLQADAQKKFSELKSLDAKLAQAELKSGLVRTGKGGMGFTRMAMRRSKKL